jgi:CheY-like chemotaxis protein
MLDHDDLKWIASTSTELNSVLQQVSRYADLSRRHKGGHNYLDLLGERVEVATKLAQALFDRVTSKILAQTAAKMTKPPAGPHIPFTVLPPASHATPTKTSAPTSKAKSEKQSSALPPIPPDIHILNPKGNRELLLLIEDEVEVAQNAAEMLAEEGYKVIKVHDGFEALKIYERIWKRIGLVILDFFLPIMDGDAVFDELRTLNPEVDVVLSSGFAEESKVSSMLAQGLRGFIPKPYTREKLLAQVRFTLDAARQPLS